MAAHLDGDECGGVDVVLLRGVSQRHADADADGGDGAEHRHVHHRDHRPQLQTHIYISRILLCNLQLGVCKKILDSYSFMLLHSNHLNQLGKMKYLPLSMSTSHDA